MEEGSNASCWSSGWDLGGSLLLKAGDADRQWTGITSNTGQAYQVTIVWVIVICCNQLSDPP